MHKFFLFLNTTIGKKIIMALSGFFLSIFLVVHLSGNLLLFKGAEAFNQYVVFLHSTKLLLRIAEVGLVSIFLIHIINGFYLTIINRKASNNRYLVSPTNKTTSLSSRSMIISGIMVLLFLVVHIRTFWVNFQLQAPDFDFYKLVSGNDFGFGRPEITLFYIICICFLSLHLKHGFESAFKTFGVVNYSYKSIIGLVSIFFWLIIPLGFISVVIYLGFNF
tara:strand:+ start:53 stop:712 length:660 start_codon:yes stop_codon:yes gene_type:complete